MLNGFSPFSPPGPDHDYEPDPEPLPGANEVADSENFAGPHWTSPIAHPRNDFSVVHRKDLMQEGNILHTHKHNNEKNNLSGPADTVPANDAELVDLTENSNLGGTFSRAGSELPQSEQRLCTL